MPRKRQYGRIASRLIAERIAYLLVPPGSTRPHEVAIRNFTKDNIKLATKQAYHWLDGALTLVKSARGNPYGDDEEALCGAILKKLGVTDAEVPLS
jgi:hypothetical protein